MLLSPTYVDVWLYIAIVGPLAIILAILVYTKRL